jgi:hypothetical protein
MLCLESYTDTLRDSMLWKESGPGDLVELFAFFTSRGIMVFNDAQGAHFFIGIAPQNRRFKPARYPFKPDDL